MYMREADECWLWPLSTTRGGYGQVTWRNKHWQVHRLAWTMVNGPIPNGMTIDHLCRTPLCYNPAHLRVLSRSENSSDNGSSRRTHCPQGHEYTSENTAFRTKRQQRAGGQVVVGVQRECRQCCRDRAAAAYYKKKASH